MRLLASSSVLAFALATAACASSPAPDAPPTGAGATPVAPLRKATVNVESRSGSTVTGTVVFEETPAADPTGPRPVRMTIHLTGLAPGDHGFHVHQNGDCSDPKADSAGPHFDFGGHHHGAMHDAMAHVGDLGNLTADASGSVDKVVDGVTKLSLLPGADNAIVGRAIVVHDKPDDLTTQPSGASGPRVGCGVVNLDP